MYVNREIELEANLVKLYGLVKGQYSHSLKAVLKREDDYDDKDGVQDGLLNTLQSLTSGLDNKSNKRFNLFDALLAFITMRQGENENDSAYMRRFKFLITITHLELRLCRHNRPLASILLLKNDYTDPLLIHTPSPCLPPIQFPYLRTF